MSNENKNEGKIGDTSTTIGELAAEHGTIGKWGDGSKWGDGDGSSGPTPPPNADGTPGRWSKTVNGARVPFYAPDAAPPPDEVA